MSIFKRYTISVARCGLLKHSPSTRRQDAQGLHAGSTRSLRQVATHTVENKANNQINNAWKFELYLLCAAAVMPPVM